MNIWMEPNEKSLHRIKKLVAEAADEVFEICFYGNDAVKYGKTAMKTILAETEDLPVKPVVMGRIFAAPGEIDDEVARNLFGEAVPVMLGCTDFLISDKADFKIYQKAVDCLLGHGVIPEVQIPILSGNLSKEEARLFYRELVDRGITSMELEHVSKYRPGGRPKSLERYDPKQYGELLILMFELWRKDRMAGKKIRIRAFENLAGAISGGHRYGCGISGTCRGRVHGTDGSGLSFCDCAALENISKNCRGCRWISICKQGCVFEYSDKASDRNYFCDAYKMYYEFALPGMLEVLRIINR